MALRFCDGFKHYTFAQILRKWTDTGGTVSLSATNARFDVSLNIAGGGNGFVKKLLDNQATWIVGFAFRRSSSIAAAAGCILSLWDGTTCQLSLNINAAGQLIVNRGTQQGTALGTSVSALAQDTWNYIEFKATIDNAAGVATVRVNGTATGWLSLTGQNTRMSSNNRADTFRFGYDANGAIGVPNLLLISDLYVCDTSGSVNNDFVGDVRVETLYPDGAGSNTTWTPDSGSNYARVNETTANDDTSYVEDSTAGHRDSYTCSNLSSTPTAIFGVQTVLTARKTDAGSRSISDVCVSGGTTSDGASVSIADTYACYATIRETDPNTSAAWTPANLNAAEFGEKLVS